MCFVRREAWDSGGAEATAGVGWMKNGRPETQWGEPHPRVANKGNGTGNGTMHLFHLIMA